MNYITIVIININNQTKNLVIHTNWKNKNYAINSVLCNDKSFKLTKTNHFLVIRLFFEIIFLKGFVLTSQRKNNDNKNNFKLHNF